MYSVYFLEDPRTGDIRYVGRTKRALPERLHGHLNVRSRNRNDHKDAWLRKLDRLGLRPSIHQIQELYSFEDSCASERYWIEFLRAQGCPLVNLATGGAGAGSFRHRPESIAKMKMSGIGKWKRPPPPPKPPNKRKRVILVDGVRFASIVQAAVSLNLSRATINNILSGRRSGARTAKISYAVEGG